MAAGSKPKYYLVEASVLPEIFAKVIEAKELLETGQVRTVADAVACVDISRSAFYKYKDFVSPFQDMSRGHLVTFNLELLDRQGVAVRSGHHCAQNTLSHFGVESAVRVSPAFYNTAEDSDRFAGALGRSLKLLRP